MLKMPAKLLFWFYQHDQQSGSFFLSLDANSDICIISESKSSVDFMPLAKADDFVQTTFLLSIDCLL